MATQATCGLQFSARRSSESQGKLSIKTASLIIMSLLSASLCGCATFSPKQSYTMPPSDFVQKSKVNNDCVSNACRKKAFFAIGPGPVDYLRHEGYANKKLGQVSAHMGNALGDTMVGASTGVGVNPLGLTLFIAGVLTSSHRSLPQWADRYRWLSSAMSDGQVIQIVYPYSPRNRDIAHTRQVMASVMATDLKVLQWAHFDHGLVHYQVMGSAYSIQEPGRAYHLFFVGTSNVSMDGAFSSAWWVLESGSLAMQASTPYCSMLDQKIAMQNQFYLASAVGVLIPGLHGKQALAVSTFVVKHPFTFYSGDNTLRNLSKAFPDAYVVGYANFCHDGNCQF